uniref:YD repeat-containing protein n=1 Tax=Prevotella sp. GTC17253 TaxID=3236793 RepID=A0AB33IVP9_9BACT
MKSLFYLFFLFVGTVIPAYSLNPEFDYYKIYGKGIKKLTTSMYDKWRVVCYFDRHGYLMREQAFHKKELKSDHIYDYIVTDSLVTIRITNISDLYPKLVKKYEDFFSPLGVCYKRRVYMNGSDTASLYIDNFVYDDGLLLSNEEATAWQRNNKKMTKVCYYYNEKKQKILKTKHFNETDSIFYSYDRMGRLTDEIKKVDSTSVLSDIVPYANNEVNKLHILYSNYDGKGNWTKSYFVTPKGKKPRSKRKIKYW